MSSPFTKYERHTFFVLCILLAFWLLSLTACGGGADLEECDPSFEGPQKPGQCEVQQAPSMHIPAAPSSSSSH